MRIGASKNSFHVRFGFRAHIRSRCIDAQLALEPVMAQFLKAFVAYDYDACSPRLAPGERPPSVGTPQQLFVA